MGYVNLYNFFYDSLLVKETSSSSVKTQIVPLYDSIMCMGEHMLMTKKHLEA